ncbi:ribosome recycling factor [Chondrinema litorale]|uniref:ribosome recycling factor n=1 Tax=Chondrinema litorale TaxID=2994555 RepID=UPI00254377EF|nr:ribosome recycling factor [Chondrinema litorale]UZR95880.1 ribosome recycling factor [Chondrinema litorale]
MEEDIAFYLEEAKDHMDKSVLHTEEELRKIRAGKANPSMLNGLMVMYYGTPTPINQVASVNTPDARTIMVKPWEKTILSEIEKAIINSDLGLNPVNDGETIRLNIPPLTEERRKQLMKQVRAEAEHGKISIRNVRKDVNDSLKKLQKDGASEDAVKKAETDVQELTDAYIKKVDDLVVVKENDIMTV